MHHTQFIAERISARIYFYKVCMWSRSGMSRGMLLHTIGIGHMCATQSDKFRYARLRYRWGMTASFGDGDGGRGRRCGGPSRLGYYYITPNSFYGKRNTCQSHMAHVRIVCAMTPSLYVCGMHSSKISKVHINMSSYTSYGFILTTSFFQTT